MSGRRLLDAAAIFKASRGVAAKHLVLRQHQLDNYNKTSTLAKALKSQTDRVTLNLKAASVLAEHFNSRRPEYPTQTSQSGSPDQEEHEKSGQKPVDAQEKAQANVPRSADHAKGIQRAVGTHIPSQYAEPPSRAASEPDEIEAYNAELRIDQEQDVFYTPFSSSGRVLSALPRVKLPKNMENAQEGDDHVPDDQLNQDVFYSGRSRPHRYAIPASQAVPEQEELSEEAYSGIFHSPKVSKRLRGQPNKSHPSKGLDLPGAKEIPVQDSKSAQENDQVASSIRKPLKSSDHVVDPESESSHCNGDEDVHKLAAGMAKNADTAPVEPTITPDDIEPAPTKAPYEMRESRVPSSRFGRIWQYGGVGNINGIRRCWRELSTSDWVWRRSWRILNAQCRQYGKTGGQAFQNARSGPETGTDDEFSGL